MIDVGRLRRGDHEYFRGLVESRGPMVMRIARAYGESADQAYDLFQEVWWLAWEKKGSYRGKGTFEAWLVRLAHNVCRDKLRKGTARKKAMKGIEREGRGDEISWRPLDPAQELDRTESHLQLIQAMDCLPPREREAVVLKRLEGLPDDEAAKIMGVREATVRSLVRHGIKRLRGILEEAWE